MRVTPSSRTTFAELDDRSAQMAARLVKAEVVKGRNAGYCALRSRLLPDRRRGRGCAPRGNAGGAAAAFRELLHDQLRVFGPHHPDTLETRLELAERGDNPVTSPERSPSSGNYSLTSNESSGPVIPSP